MRVQVGRRTVENNYYYKESPYKNLLSIQIDKYKNTQNNHSLQTTPAKHTYAINPVPKPVSSRKSTVWA